MKLSLIGLLVVLSACQQYVPQAAVYSSTQGLATLAGSECKNQNVTYVTQETSAVTWTLDQVKGEASAVSSKNPGNGRIVLAKGLLNQVSGVIDFNALATSTGDPLRDQLFQELLFGTSVAAPFRFTIETLIGTATAVANGATIAMKASGTLDIGGRKAAIIMPVKITEKDGIYSLAGEIDLNAREARPAVNAIDLDDKLKALEDRLAMTFAKPLNLDFNLQFKNDCLATP